MVKMRQRGKLAQVLRARVCPDPTYILTIRKHGGWMSAREVAEAHGHSWYIVAHALRRLTEGGLLEEDVIEIVGTQRIREHSRVYRARPLAGEKRTVEVVLPGWLCPQAVVSVGERRVIDGACGIRRWDDEDKEPGK